jgi:hypothetical protein
MGSVGCRGNNAASGFLEERMKMKGGSAQCFVGGCGGSDCHSSNEGGQGRVTDRKRCKPRPPWPPCEPLLRSQGPCCQASVNQLRGTVSFVIAASVAADQNNTKPAKVELLFTNLVLQHFNYRVVPHHQLPFQSRALRMHRDKDSQASTRRPRPQFALSRFQKCTPNGRPSLACIFVGADPPAINPPAAAAGFGGMVRRAGLALTSRA